MSNAKDSKIVVILGSAPEAVDLRAWNKPAHVTLVALNNAWRVRPDWDYLVVPDDFPADRRPTDTTPTQELVTSEAYVPANNRFGGVVYAGGTMAFSAGYWALEALRPRVMAFFGCDMTYSRTGATHFYGTGTADPLREDVTLRNLEAKSARLMLHAAREGCSCVRLSTGPSRLVFPTLARAALEDDAVTRQAPPWAGGTLFDQIKAEEAALGYVAPTGRYWEDQDAMSVAQIDRLDGMWLDAAELDTDTPMQRRA